MKHKEHFRTAVYQTPFHPRTSALNTLNEWHRWKDYTTARCVLRRGAGIRGDP